MEASTYPADTPHLTLHSEAASYNWPDIFALEDVWERTLSLNPSQTNVETFVRYRIKITTYGDVVTKFDNPAKQIKGISEGYTDGQNGENVKAEAAAGDFVELVGDEGEAAFVVPISRLMGNSLTLLNPVENPDSDSFEPFCRTKSRTGQSSCSSGEESRKDQTRA
jgi:hypothetical protein